MSQDSFKARKTLKVGNKTYVYFSLAAAEKNGLKGISKLPYSMRVLLENLLRHEDGNTVTKSDIEAVVARKPDLVVSYRSPGNAGAVGRLRAMGVPVVELLVDR